MNLEEHSDRVLTNLKNNVIDPDVEYEDQMAMWYILEDLQWLYIRYYQRVESLEDRNKVLESKIKRIKSPKISKLILKKFNIVVNFWYYKIRYKFKRLSQYTKKKGGMFRTTYPT